MDPISIGVAVGMAVVSQVTKKIMEKAADPEKIANSVNWLFLATAHFFKVRKKETPPETAIAPPPSPEAKPLPPPAVSDALVEEKRAAVEEIATSLNAKQPSAAQGGVRVKVLDDFAAEQIANEITSLLNQLDTYLGNLRFEEEKAAQYGGPAMVTVIVMNTIRLQRREIGARLMRLNTAVGKAYGVSAPDLDLLTAALKE